MSIKLLSSSQARIDNRYKNLKVGVLHCNKTVQLLSHPYRAAS